MIRKRVQHRPNWPDGTGYDPKLVITVTGTSDVYRIARLLEGGQLEFAAMARAILRSMDKQAPGVVASLTHAMGPANLGGRYRGRRKRVSQLKLELGMPAEDLEALERAVRA